MSRPRFTFRPNLQNADHLRAWEALNAVPEGHRNAFLVRAILQTVQRESMENNLRRIIREELQSAPAPPSMRKEETVPQEMIGFLNSLLGE